MVGRYYQIILFVLTLTSCVSSTNKEVTIQNTIQDGDIIVRKEGGFISSLFSSVATQNNAFSHVGVLVVDPNGMVNVIHSELMDTKEKSSLRMDALPVFLAMADTAAVFRLPWADSMRCKVAEEAQKLLQQGAAFDLDFDNATDSALYCTEFVAKTINRAVGHACIKPTKHAAGKIGYSIDDILIHCQWVASCFFEH